MAFFVFLHFVKPLFIYETMEHILQGIDQSCQDAIYFLY
jgi:hypothetical protein